MDQARISKAARDALIDLAKAREAIYGAEASYGPLASVKEHLEFILENSKRKRTAAQREVRAAKAKREARPLVSPDAMAAMKAKLADLKKDTK